METTGQHACCDGTGCQGSLEAASGQRLGRNLALPRDARQEEMNFLHLAEEAFAIENNINSPTFTFSILKTVNACISYKIGTLPRLIR